MKYSNEVCNICILSIFFKWIVIRKHCDYDVKCIYAHQPKNKNTHSSGVRSKSFTIPCYYTFFITLILMDSMHEWKRRRVIKKTRHTVWQIWIKNAKTQFQPWNLINNKLLFIKKDKYKTLAHSWKYNNHKA